MVCVKILWTPYNLMVLEEFLRNNQYLMNRLVSIEERSLPQEIDFRKLLNYEARQKLYEALPIMLREKSLLEEENQDQIELYIKHKSEFTVGIHMLVDQIHSVLKRDDECQQTRGFQAVKTPKFYPSSEQLWTEMPVDIIKTASQEHEECMKSLDDVRA